jgi:EAL and modified HD-GYP domain-containing signal transduction protein
VWLSTLAKQPSTPNRELERVLRSDPGLVFRLLRIAGTRAGTPLRSIAQALEIVGRDGLERWLSLTTPQRAQAAVPEPDAELLGKSVFRALFCEALGVPDSGRDRGMLYLVGLFSLADMLFQVPLPDLFDRINVPADVRAALLDREGPYADALHVVEAYELGLWEAAADAAERLGIGANYLPSLYTQALRWAAEYLPAVERRRAS